ncbi:MAG: chromate transporter [Acidovorax sp.]|jgi:chromate transporter|nr:chromate transporter [Acidovorax sp.]
MNAALNPLVLDAAGWLQLTAYFLSLSLLSVGGAMATAPDMHRYVVESKAWLSGDQFSTAISIAQAAPGPNIMYVALLGWNIGLNAAGPDQGLATWLAALGACLACLIGMLLPSSVLVWSSTRWMRRNSMRRSVRAFRWGMMPLVVGLVLATGWILAARDTGAVHAWGPWLVAAITTLLVWKTRLHLLWMLGAGALLGALGWI